MTLTKLTLSLFLATFAIPAHADETKEEYFLSCNFDGRNFAVPLRQGGSLFQTIDEPIHIGDSADFHINATVTKRPKYSNEYRYISFSATCGKDFKDPMFRGCTEENVGKKFFVVGPQKPEEAVVSQTHLQIRVASFELSCDLN